MKGNPENSCMGGYGKCLDVKITNQCNAACSFCIERGGYSPCAASVEAMIHSAVSHSDYRIVLILGGEPLMYPHLETYLKGIRPHKDHIYITTNGSLLTEEMAAMLAEYLDGVNISIHHYTEVMNNAVYKTACVPFDRLKRAIRVLNMAHVPVRFNSNLVAGYLDTREDVDKMIEFAANMGADEIRFSELQNSPENYVDARTLFDGLTDNPFCDGCEKIVCTKPIKVRVKMTCGCVNPLKEPIVRDEEPERHCRVEYPDASVSPGWITSAVGADDGCHRTIRTGRPPYRASGAFGCHGRPLLIGSDGCH